MSPQQLHSLCGPLADVSDGAARGVCWRTGETETAVLVGGDPDPFPYLYTGPETPGTGETVRGVPAAVRDRLKHTTTIEPVLNPNSFVLNTSLEPPSISLTLKTTESRVRWVVEQAKSPTMPRRNLKPMDSRPLM
ncbi:hypothetical protein K501DRAFT_266540 [Backusella circina FSU 941]|nr:hypothetical protein K501DRAFT_266540 [Backusella circina FSU 941]